MSTGQKAIIFIVVILVLVGIGVGIYFAVRGGSTTSLTTPIPGKSDGCPKGQAIYDKECKCDIKNNWHWNGDTKTCDECGDITKFTYDYTIKKCIPLSAGGTTPAPAGAAPPLKTGDTMMFSSWHIWVDEGTFNFWSHKNGRVMRLWKDKGVTTNETWTKFPAQNAPDSYQFRYWSMGLNMDTFIIQSRKTGSMFTITSEDSKIGAALTPSTPLYYNAGLPDSVDFAGVWLLETDENEMRIIHVKSKNTYRINKDGFGFDAKAVTAETGAVKPEAAPVSTTTTTETPFPFISP